MIYATKKSKIEFLPKKICPSFFFRSCRGSKIMNVYGGKNDKNIVSVQKNDFVGLFFKNLRDQKQINL